MKKGMMLAAATAMAILGSSVATADPGEGPNITEPYQYVIVYYNGGGQEVGYEVMYCDGRTEYVIQPGQNIFFIDIIEGNCGLGPLPLPGGF